MKQPTHNAKLKIFTLILFLVSYFLFFDSAMAAKLETGLPNIPGNRLTSGQEVPSYINYLFIFGLGLIAFLALAQMMIGGLTYILAAGNVAKVEDAKDTIKQALIGLGLLLVSYLLLNTINPDLVKLRNPNLTPVSLKPPTPTGPVLGPGQTATGQKCQKDADCTAGGNFGGAIICNNGQCVESVGGGY